MATHLLRIIQREIPRLPLNGSLDLTYRCNNNCRHCWLRRPPQSSEQKAELTIDQILRIVEEARALGCRTWFISGGEPMLRPEFPEIFDYVTRRCAYYTLNTNGTLITPRIARLMCRHGRNMVALYGATPEIHDYITRTPGSFEATMRGLALLKEAGADFLVQIVPMQGNFHQFHDMVRLAESKRMKWRVGAAWLYLSATRDSLKNREILRQRLSPEQVLELDPPDPTYADEAECETEDHYPYPKDDDLLLAPCIAARREFHIDPYGQMSFCCYVKDPALRYDLKNGTFREAWERFIPSLAQKIRGGKEYRQNCGRCELRQFCRWCPVYAYLEHGRYSAPVKYLCALARETKRFITNWEKHHRRYYRIGGLTIRVEADLPITNNTFEPRFIPFETIQPADESIKLRHHFRLLQLSKKDLGQVVYRRLPWRIYKKDDSWIYLIITTHRKEERIHTVAIFNHNHTRARIYHDGEEIFRKGHLPSLSLLPTDQIFLARVLADQQGCFLHAGGVVLNGKGLLFVGHSTAGKSTMVRMLRREARILCDDRIIVRRAETGFHIYGTWSSGEVIDVSPEVAPLGAILFLKKAKCNRLISLTDKAQVVKGLLCCLVKPLVTADWWGKMFGLIEQIAEKIPCYILYFDKSGRVKELLKTL